MKKKNAEHPVCPYCGSDRVHCVSNMETDEEDYYCMDCEMEWNEVEEARQEIREANFESQNKSGF